MTSEYLSNEQQMTQKWIKPMPVMCTIRLLSKTLGPYWKPGIKTKTLNSSIICYWLKASHAEKGMAAPGFPLLLGSWGDRNRWFPFSSSFINQLCENTHTKPLVWQSPKRGWGLTGHETQLPSHPVRKSLQVRGDVHPQVRIQRASTAAAAEGWGGGRRDFHFPMTKPAQIRTWSAITNLCPWISHILSQAKSVTLRHHF